MKLLLIEDSSIKADAIRDFYESRSLRSELKIERSYQAGLRSIERDAPELIILDMTLPNFDVQPGGRPGKPRPLGGYDILRKIKRRNFDSKVVVLTQFETFEDGSESYSFEALEAKCFSEFERIFLGMIFFSLTSDGWKDQIGQIIDSFGSVGVIK